jgi:hypothetical protein
MDIIWTDLYIKISRDSKEVGSQKLPIQVQHAGHEQTPNNKQALAVPHLFRFLLQSFATHEGLSKMQGGQTPVFVMSMCNASILDIYH